MGEVKTITIQESVYADNAHTADLIREQMKRDRTLFLNFMSAPGSGKTTTLITLINLLKNEMKIGVMDVDIESAKDAQRVADETGVFALQIHNGGLCHIDADMVSHALMQCDAADLDLLILENIGNLVCPAEFDTGAHRNIMILSVPEGDDKPLKYPLMFQVSDVVLINKTDTLAYFDFDMEKARERILRLNPRALIFPVSAKTGEGFGALTEWIRAEQALAAGGRKQETAAASADARQIRGPLAPEDYVEPRCVLCDEPYGKVPPVRAVPQQRIIRKMDEYMSRRDYAGAERHLLYWLEEARLGHDCRGELLIRNELIGHYRKTGKRREAFENIEAALELLESMDFAGTVSGGTTFVNAATACSAFQDHERAMRLFEKARDVYTADPKTGPELLGGLHNNMGLCCAALGRFDEAAGYYEKAMQNMRKVPGGELETAITLLNMADLSVMQKGMEQAEADIRRCLEKAESLLEGSAAPRDGYYAFVCEKCAPVFAFYGYFLAAQELESRAEEIYGRG